ncbi:MAG: CotH kinase family protein, partial [Bacteroidota bacterium]
SMQRFFTLYLLLAISVSANAQNLPDAWHLEPAYHRLTINGQHPSGFYDESQMQTIQLWFAQPDYWQQMTANYASKTNIPATMIVGADTFPNVGVRFKGNTSYNMIQNSQKKSFNITLDYIDPTQDIDGYETLNLNNAFEDASFMREVAYLHQIRKHIPAAKANYAHLYINGSYWGVYPNVQQLNRQYLKEWFFEEKGTLWRADRPAGTGGPGGPGGGPGWGDGTAAINFLGADTATYKQYYTLKSTDDPTPWDELV